MDVRFTITSLLFSVVRNILSILSMSLFTHDVSLPEILHDCHVEIKLSKQYTNFHKLQMNMKFQNKIFKMQRCFASTQK